MKCPVCKEINLTISERQGIEIDYCPECRGVWLDRGELDKIIDRSTINSSPIPERSREDHTTHRNTVLSHHDQPRHDQYAKRKKGSFLSELFEFD